jgi:Putative Flp pilus-assembly TadE/G-like
MKLGSARGQIAVLYAGIIVVLLGAIALCADMSVMYFNWQQLRGAADAAVLAGANYLPSDSSSAQTAAVKYAEMNGIQAGEIVGTPTVSADQLSLTITLSRTVPYYFAKALGMTNATMNVTATGGIDQNTAFGRGLMPIGLSCPGGASSGNCPNGQYVVGTTYKMKQDQSQTSLPGNWGALALGGNGASIFQQNLEFGYVGSIPSAVATEPGNIVGPTEAGIATRIAAGVNADPSIGAGSAPPNGASPSSYEYDPRFVVFPMVDYSGGKGGKNGNGNNPGTGLPVVQYAQMWLLGTSGNNATINAVFMGTIPNPPPSGSTVANFGMLSPVLVN